MTIGSVLFRPQRGGLASSMREAVEVNSWADLERAVYPHVPVKVEKYGAFDSRIGWDTHIVLGEMHGHELQPLGFTTAMMINSTEPMNE